MVKKVLGLIILVIGAVIFLLFSIAFISNLATQNQQVQVFKNKMHSFDERQAAANDAAATLFAHSNSKKISVIQVIFISIGAGITYGGLVLYKNGKRETILAQ
jgi:hypothetical protein